MTKQNENSSHAKKIQNTKTVVAVHEIEAQTVTQLYSQTTPIGSHSKAIPLSDATESPYLWAREGACSH